MRRSRTFRAQLMYGPAGHLELRRNDRATWLCIYDGDGRFQGSIDSVTALRNLAAAIEKALPPKRVKA